MLLEPRCGGCGGGEGPICGPCLAALRPAGVVRIPGVEEVWVLLAYAGPGRTLVQGLKFRNHRAALGLLAAALSERVDGLRPEVVTWVPALPAHRRERGYDQAELLARRLARSLHVPCRGLLVRRGDRAQTGLARAARLVGPSLEAKGPVPATTLVVDDVVTTGGSLAAAAHALRAGGASRVHAAVLAATPEPTG